MLRKGRIWRGSVLLRRGRLGVSAASSVPNAGHCAELGHPYFCLSQTWVGRVPPPSRKPCGEPGAPVSARGSGGGETFQGGRSVKQVEGVCGVVDEIDAIADCDEAEERTGPGRRASAVVDELDGDLLVDLRVDLDDVSVVSVCDQDVMVIGCNARPSGLLSVPL